MTDAALPIQKSMRTAIMARLTTEGYANVDKRVVVDPDSDTPLPYLVFTGITGLPAPTKTTEGMRATASLTAWAQTYVESARLIDYMIQSTTDRTAPLTIVGFTTVKIELDFRGAPFKQEAPGTDTGWYWGTPARIMFHLVEE